jgi:serine phosphatase RsbU (regulator of sigma subunit)
MERVREYLEAHPDAAIQPLVDGLVGALMEFLDGAIVEDDITIVGMDVLG